MSGALLVLADAALERGEVPTVPHAGSPVPASAVLERPDGNGIINEEFVYESDLYDAFWRFVSRAHQVTL